MHPSDPLAKHFPRLNPLQKRALEKLNIQTVHDLLFTFPSRYGEKIETLPVAHLVAGEQASVVGRVSGIKIGKSFTSRKPMGELTLTDDTRSIKAIWFHQVFLAKKVPDGGLARISGTVTERNGSFSFINPEIEALVEADVASAGSLFGNGAEFFVPVYPETRGLSSSWFHHAIGRILKGHGHENIPDPLPAEILKKYHLPTLASALVFIHAPQKQSDADAARKRFAFEEIFGIQLSRAQERAQYEHHASFRVPEAPHIFEDFKKRLPFPLTVAQERAILGIAHDFASDRPMARLLEGDVGSGKTAVAAAAAYLIIHASAKGQPLQVAYMAPTEILARQQFNSFIGLFKHLGLPIGLVTGSGAYKYPSKISRDMPADVSRTQFLKWVASGEMPVIVGTHALIQKKVQFKNLALVIIDEQHRFGLNQRAKLLKKTEKVPHLLSMTATPIPRTLALTIYGDLDLSLLDELPPGRKQVITEIVPPNKRDTAYEKIRSELAAGRQLFVICPRVNEPDPTKEMALNAKSAVAEAARLKREVFPKHRIAVVNGKMKPADKEKVMADFAAHKLDILVATSVIEVGVNVPNSTQIVIEGAERFGLAQLHQLRGRVVRSSHQAHCYLFTETKSEKSMERLKALATAKNGFELAEMDLALRGAGELSGTKQWGISDLGMEAIKNIKMVEAAREEAIKLIEKDPDLVHHPLLAEKIATETKEIHFE
jgi:ATP-dependent DNA helicase RecG